MGIPAMLVQLCLPSFLVLPCLQLIGQSICRPVLSMIWNRLEDQYVWPAAAESRGSDLAKCWALDGAQNTRLYRRGPAPEGEDGREHAAVVRCVFCLCDLEDGEEIRELRCEHLFHRTCLDRWVGHGRATCPICRKSLSSMVAEAELPCGDWVDS